MNIKRIINRIIMVVLMSGALLTTSCEEGGICTRGNGNTETQVIAIPEFTGIDLQISGDVYLTQGDEQFVEVRGESNLIERLKTDLKRDVWEIDFQGCVNQREDFEVFITVPDLEEVRLSGAGRIVTENRFDVQDMEIKLSGAGDIVMDLDADKLSTWISGAGNIDLDLTAHEIESSISGSGQLNLAGETHQYELDIAGAGDAYTFPLETNETDIHISGSGNAEVHVEDRLDVRISGSGDVYYTGNPTLDVNITGSGKVIDAN